MMAVPMPNPSHKTYTFHVSGRHCKDCVLFVESALLDVTLISRAVSSLKDHSVVVTGDFGDKPAETVAEELSRVLIKHGYTLSVDEFDKLTTGKQVRTKNWSEFTIAVPISLAFIISFIVLQKVGLVNLVGTDNVSYGTAFIIGIVASLSTCMATVGGLLLSMSATFAREGDRVKPQTLFHMGRIASFFVLGGVIGAIGSVFTLNVEATFALGIIIGLVMLVLGINLLDVFHFTKRLQPSMPRFVSKHALGISKFNHTLTPLLVGIATFFLPCGFTQSMQLYTLTTGSFMRGGFTMLVFALGTLPVLALISFSSFSIQNNKNAGVFFKTAGLVVILFALFNLVNSMVVIGVISPLFNF